MPTTNHHDVPKTKFDIKLDETKITLEACQEQHSLKSCSLCEHYLACDTRRNYVQAVYDSMSKGETGGFEF
jgi:hypothetical protein